MTQHEASGRFTFNLAVIAPDWSDTAAREAEWARLLGHYLPRLRDHFTRITGDSDLADDVVGHIVRRALLKLHELGSSHAAWQWFTRTGLNHLTDLRRRKSAEANRLAAYARENTALTAEEVPPLDVVDRVAELSDGSAAEPLDPLLSGRLPINRPEWEARLAARSDDDRRLLQLVEVDGKSHAQAAELLGLPSPGASRKRHSRACHYLRTGLRAP